MQYVYALNTRELKAGSAHALHGGHALNNGVRLTTRVYGTVVGNFKGTDSVLKAMSHRATHLQWNILCYMAQSRRKSVEKELGV